VDLMVCSCAGVLGRKICSTGPRGSLYTDFGQLLEGRPHHRAVDSKGPVHSVVIKSHSSECKISSGISRHRYGPCMSRCMREARKVKSRSTKS